MLIITEESLIVSVFQSILVNYRNHKWLKQRTMLAVKDTDAYALNFMVLSGVLIISYKIIKL